jgi:hypothetical protein
MLFKKEYAKESTHWYAKDGTPAYEVPAKDGSMRATTLRDARKLSLVPSVTQVLSVVAKPGLEAWKMQNTILAALTLPRFPGESDDAFAVRVVQDSKKQAQEAAALGSSIHASLEKWYSDEAIPSEHAEYVGAVHHAVKQHFGEREWVAEKSFAHSLGFGGKVDLHCEDGIVLDFKTSAFDDAEKKEGYDEHLMQGAAYGEGLHMIGPRIANVYISTSVPGLVKIIEWSPEDRERGWYMFSCLLRYWKLSKKYQPESE